MQKKNARDLWKKQWKVILQDPVAFKPRHDYGPDQKLLEKYAYRIYEEWQLIWHVSEMHGHGAKK